MFEQLVERRTAMRYPVNLDTTCPMVAPITEDFGEARIKDVSTDGIGLVMNHPVEAGSILMIALRNDAQRFFRLQLIQVVHVTRALGGGYQVGGAFLAPLTYEELRTLLM
jgi:hypothetical protein